MKYYDMKDIGKFPRRLPPISRYPQLTDLSSAINFTDIATQLDELNLAIYTPSLFIYDSKKSDYDIDIEGSGISIDGREKGLRKLMATNLLKRLESSVNSFRLTLTRICEYISETIEKIDAYEKTHEENDVDVRVFDGDLDSQDSETEPFSTKKSKIRLRDMDFISWRREISSDLEKLRLLLYMLRDITPEHDSKLQMLLSDLKHKFKNPINPGNKKVIIFTAFADTADYLYENLSKSILKDCGLHTALITGSTEGRCTIPGFRISFNNILTAFSPRSKEGHVKKEIDVLIATDCISEGQNLQDCDFLICYDIHWNPVRIIQRFGRVDRIGSRNEVIQLMNYWPDIKLDEYIKLKGRVESRMKATVLTATGDDNLLSANEKGDLEYRRNQLRRLQEEVVDMEDMDTGVNIMDLGLNEFRLDLLTYIKQHPDIEHAPYGMNAVVAVPPSTPNGVDIKPGVVFVLKNRNNAVNIDRKNLLHPFYMVYLGDDGTVLCDHLHPKHLLDTLRLLCKGKSDHDPALCSRLNKETKDGRKMEKYSELLQEAVGSIVEKKEETDIDSLFSLGETTALRGEINGLDDFELITFLIIRES